MTSFMGKRRVSMPSTIRVQSCCISSKAGHAEPAGLCGTPSLAKEIQACCICSDTA